MTTDANTFLMGSGGRSAVFREINDQVWGTVVNAEVRQQTSFESGEPLFWDDGKPRMQLVITLQTDEEDDEDDDGLRRVYAKGQMLQAIRKAIVKAGKKGIENGGRLVVRYVGDAEPKRKGMSGAKQYFAKYEPPVETVAVPEENGYEDGPEPDSDDLPF